MTFTATPRIDARKRICSGSTPSRLQDLVPEPKVTRVSEGRRAERKTMHLDKYKLRMHWLSRPRSDKFWSGKDIIKYYRQTEINPAHNLEQGPASRELDALLLNQVTEREQAELKSAAMAQASSAAPAAPSARGDAVLGAGLPRDDGVCALRCACQTATESGPLAMLRRCALGSLPSRKTHSSAPSRRVRV